MSAASARASLAKKLAHQSQKRATSENGILLGSFAKTHIPHMGPSHLQSYSRIVSENDLDLFAWLSGITPVPEYYKTCAVFKQLQGYITQVRNSAAKMESIK